MNLIQRCVQSASFTDRTPKPLLVFCSSILLAIESIAGDGVNLDVIADSWDAAELKVKMVESALVELNQDIRTAALELAKSDDQFPYEAEAPKLKPSEFESDQEFNARVKKQKERDAQMLKLLAENRETYKRETRDKIARFSAACIEYTNQLNQAIAELSATTNRIWTLDIKLDVAKLPYFDRESMSFKDISCPLVTQEDKDKKIRFSVDQAYRSVSFKFDDIKKAQTFKEGLLNGTSGVNFHYEFLVGRPTAYTVSSAWTEKKPNRYKQTGKAIGIGVRILQALNGSRPLDEDFAYLVEHQDTSDAVHHAAVSGRDFRVVIKNCIVQCVGNELKGWTVIWDGAH